MIHWLNLLSVSGESYTIIFQSEIAAQLAFSEGMENNADREQCFIDPGNLSSDRSGPGARLILSRDDQVAQVPVHENAPGI